MINKIKTTLSVTAALIALHAFSSASYANEELPTPPDFPACLSFSEPGDYAHYDFGTHQIVGNGLVEGADDVYTFGDNYVQCFCSQEGEGIQTNWWKTDKSGNLRWRLW